MHAWPVLRNFTSAAPLAACSGSASSNTMNGAWPPSSSDTRFSWLRRVRRSIALPTSVEPVKRELAHAGGSRAARRDRAPDPAGRDEVDDTRRADPASASTSNIAIAHSGVCSAGFSTIVQPAASAGATFRVIIEIG